ncbi:Hypothetical protein FORC77_2672 [Vibrio vulnificus]|nr:Hypothetical protein FORC77_2672 [Vibrio vulnificus]
MGFFRRGMIVTENGRVVKTLNLPYGNLIRREVDLAHSQQTNLGKPTFNGKASMIGKHKAPIAMKVCITGTLAM